MDVQQQPRNKKLSWTQQLVMIIQGPEQGAMPQ
jgi:hypothetical protein